MTKFLVGLEKFLQSLTHVFVPLCAACFILGIVFGGIG